jgi:hypothetical protein
MNLWLISQTVNDGYDTYDSAVVCAGSVDDAQLIHPNGSERWVEKKGWVHAKGHNGSGYGWTTPENVKVVHIGSADCDVPEGVVCSSFNAG